MHCTRSARTVFVFVEMRFITVHARGFVHYSLYGTQQKTQALRVPAQQYRSVQKYVKSSIKALKQIDQ